MLPMLCYPFYPGGVEGSACGPLNRCMAPYSCFESTYCVDCGSASGYEVAEGQCVQSRFLYNKKFLTSVRTK